ncbi:hypothetical protein OH76DRAFT_178032 [Lentinus brumalis]|uniref:Uncharacterized protein n=1 Tax=Lentinus brumalis TaxID=2498619 RepID=A0A371CNE6_9APHY|nr:hypothetical protein OH76DRAFT_178032 [Polyporus brumalis]
MHYPTRGLPPVKTLTALALLCSARAAGSHSRYVRTYQFPRVAVSGLIIDYTDLPHTDIHVKTLSAKQVMMTPCNHSGKFFPESVNLPLRSRLALDWCSASQDSSA